MFTVSVEFLHGTFRADPDGTANTGQLRHGEWPPSVSRLFAALVAADGTRKRCRVTDGSELEWFEHLPPPAIHAAQQVHHEKLCDRYVVKSAHRYADKKVKDKPPEVPTHQEYIAREGAMSRPGVRVALRQPRVVYRWDVAPPPDATLAALQLRAARVGYLGTSDSPVRVRIATQMPSDCPEQVFVPDEGGDTLISVAKPGDIHTLDRMYDQWCERGAAVARLQFPSLRHNAAYRSPGATPRIDRGEVVAWLRLATAVSGRRISVLTRCFKKAVLSQHQRIHGDDPPAILHGHGCGSQGYEIARYCALPDVGYKYSRGRIYGLALWMPPGSDGTTRRQAGDAARSIRRLSGSGIDVAVAPRDEEERQPFAAHPQRWTRQARHWATAFPAVHERRRTLDLPEITLWCQHAGLPEPVDFRSSRTPFVPGALDLAPVEVNRPGRPGLPYSHVELWFAEPVAGPVIIGSGRQRGFGFCVPVFDQGDDA